MVNAVLDACVLFSAGMRDLLMWLATQSVFQPKWTEEIHEEWIESVLEERPHVKREALERTRDLMNQHGGDCNVGGYKPLISDLSLPDPDDRHILATAIAGGASLIVTWNLSDFPAEVLQDYHIRALSPDEFLCELLEEQGEKVLAGMRVHRESLKRPARTPMEYVEALKAAGLKKAAEVLLFYMESL